MTTFKNNEQAQGDVWSNFFDSDGKKKSVTNSWSENANNDNKAVGRAHGFGETSA